MKDVRDSHVTEFAILLAVLLPIAASRADNFTTSTNQFFGTPPQTWNNAVWQSGPVSPTASNTYEVLSGGLIRNPTDSTTETFPGDSLMLDAGSRFRATGWSAITVNFPGAGGNPGLILNGGKLQAASGANNQATTIAGQMSIVADSTIDQGWRSRAFIVTAQISGSNNLTLINGSQQNPVDLQSTNNSYSGNWFVTQGTLKGTGNGSLGTGNITVANGANFEVNYDIQSPGTLTLSGSNSVMILHQNCQFSAITINGVPLTSGTYSYDVLVALFPGNFAMGGSGGITIPASADLSSSDSTGTSDASISVASDSSDPTDSAISMSADLVSSLAVNTTAPTVPSGVMVGANSSSQITVSWNASTDNSGSGLGGYYVYRDATMIGKADGTSYVDTGLSPGTPYCYTVVSFDNDGNTSSASAPACATTAASATTQVLDTVAPAISSAVIVSVNSSSQITISWNKSTDSGGSGMAGYRVYRNGTLVGTTTGTSYADTGLSSKTQYCYTVVSYDNAGNTAPLSAESCATTPAVAGTTPPTVPSGVIATAKLSSLIAIAWNSSTDTGGPGLAGYKIYRNGTLINIVTGTNYPDTHVSASTQYCYTIVAYDSNGTNSSASAQACATTPVAADNTAPTTPGSVTAGINSSSQITVTWNASTDTGGSGLAGYEVYRNGTFVNATTASSYVDSGLSAGTQYCYTIMAYDNAGNVSTASAQACGTTPAAPSNDPLPATRKLGGTGWSGHVGVPGGIPARTTIYTTIAAGASLATVQNAINSCPSNQVVLLGPGTFNWTGQGTLTITKSYVTLRGSGLTNTVIITDTHAVVIGDSNWWNEFATPVANNHIAWTGGYAQGTTVITVANAANLTVGNLLFLDQANDADTTAYSPDNPDGPYVTGEYTSVANPLQGYDRIQFQVNRIAAISGNTVTLTEPLYMPNWNANNAPQVWWETAPKLTQYSGVEDLMANNSAGGGDGIDVEYTYGCWVKDCYVTGPVAHNGYIAPTISVRCEIRHCTLQGPGSTDDYGMRTRMVSGMLMEDNIGNNCGTFMMVNGVSGSVYAYNFGINLQAQSGFLTEGLLTHGGTPNMNLFEGNWMPAFGLDSQWQNSAYNVAFRDRFTGTNDGPFTVTGNNQPVSIMEMHRHTSVIGCILGKVGTHTWYQDIGDTSPCHDNNPEAVCRVYYIGLRAAGAGCDSVYDPQVLATLIRAVNWDTATLGIDAQGYTTNNIPASYLYSSKPSYFSNLAWPAFDPARGLAIAQNSMAYTNIPAGYRYVHGVDP